ncbi:hypothetical protein LZ30DRAFT_744191 [Colletotrichum cereale]|nr:hypothetical protein LZ30DRAFT_744191 [Colletotrichum cereale]
MAPTCGTIDAGPLPETRAKPRVYCIDKGSINDILSKNAGLHLFVKPIKWADHHLALLGIKFHNLPPVDDPSPRVDLSEATVDIPAPAQALINALDHLLKTEVEESRIRSILTVMSMLYPGRMSFLNITELHQHFGGRVYRDAFKSRRNHDNWPVQAAWEATPARPSFINPPESMPTRTQGSADLPAVANVGRRIASKKPILVYVDLKSIAATRRNMYMVSLCRSPVKCPKKCRCNKPVKKIRKLLYRRIVPSKRKEDPFLAAVILALAQRSFYRELMPPSDESFVSSPASPALQEPEFHDVMVHILDVDNEKPSSPCFTVYKGLVTKELLYKFHEPTKNPSAAGDQTLAGTMEGKRGMKIDYTNIPIWPIKGLKERLSRALGKEIVGSFDEENIEKWKEIADPNLKK